jgi:hypothetical protein
MGFEHDRQPIGQRRHLVLQLRRTHCRRRSLRRQRNDGADERDRSGQAERSDGHHSIIY